jgi:uncharacterized protein
VWRAIHRASTRTVAGRVVVAATFLERLRGWIGRRPEPDEGLWLPRCRCIHTCGLPAAIDLVWCGRDGLILRVDRAVRPWRATGATGADAVGELAAGGASGLRPGDYLDLVI